MEFDAPKGFELPEDVAEGDTFDAMASIKLGKGGKLMLVSLDGASISGEDEASAEDEMEDEMEGEEKSKTPSFLASAEKGISEMMGG